MAACAELQVIRAAEAAARAVVEAFAVTGPEMKRVAPSVAGRRNRTLAVAF